MKDQFENDPFEEFEFKPLSEGLGFHKKNKSKDDSDSAQSTTALNATTTPLLIDRDLAYADASRPELIPPLPRARQMPEFREKRSSDTASNSSVDEILKTLNQNKRPEFKEKINLHQEVTNWIPDTVNASALFLDFMLVLAANLLCMIMVLVVTHADLFTNLRNPDENNFIYLSIAAMGAGVTWIYLTVNRMFLHQTPGEWVFDQRTGTPQDAEKASYVWKVALRNAVVVMTGFVLLPILSLILNKDIAGNISGVNIYKKA